MENKLSSLSFRWGAKSTAPKVDTKKIDKSKIQARCYKKKRHLGPVVGLIVALLLFLSVSFGNLGKVSLPNSDQVHKNLDTLGIGTEILTKADNGTIARYFTGCK